MAVPRTGASDGQSADRFGQLIVPKRSKRQWEAPISFWVSMAPMLIGLFVFTFLPIGWGFLISLSRARNSISLGDFVGFDNYSAILRDAEFRKSLRTIIIFTAFIVPLTFFFSLGL